MSIGGPSCGVPPRRTSIILDWAVGPSARLTIYSGLQPTVGDLTWVEPHRRFKLASVQEVPQGLTEDAIPLCQRVQLLRILPQSSQEAGDPQIGPACLCRARRACC